MRLRVVPLPPAGGDQRDPAAAFTEIAIEVQRPLEADGSGVDIPLKQLHPRHTMAIFDPDAFEAFQAGRDEIARDAEQPIQ